MSERLNAGVSKMTLWRQLTRVLRDRDAEDRDIADEVAHYLASSAADRGARGEAPDHAPDGSVRGSGSPTRDAVARAARWEDRAALAVREEVRAYGWENAVEAVLGDVRHGVRGLRRNPGYAAVAVLTLALGIGASTAIFRAVHPILLEPLPYPDARRLVTIADRTGAGEPADVTFGTYRELVERGRSFDALAVARPWQPTLTGEGVAVRLEGQRVSAGYFEVLGVAPALGRRFDAAEDRVGGAAAVVLSDALWRRRFAGDSAILGRAITLDGVLHTVIGVLPPRFENVLAPSAHIWTTLRYDASLPSFEGREWGHHLRMVGRRSAGVDLAAARAEVDGIARAPVAGFVRPPWADLSQGLFVRPLRDDVTAAVRPVLLAVVGAVLLLLGIACVNVTNLVLARGARRHDEFALRGALGAGHGRLIQQLVTEGLLLAALGGALGLLAAAFGVRALGALAPPDLPRLDAIRLDGTVFAFASLVTTLVGVATGVLPALHAVRAPAARLGHGGLTTGGRRRVRRTLVVIEVALALALMAGATLLFRSVRLLFAVAPGFDPAHTLVLQVQTSNPGFDDETARRFEQALDAVRRVPGVAAAALTSQLPLGGEADIYGAIFENDADPDSDHGVFRYAVSPGYFEALRIPLRRGRLLDARDAADARVAVVISESLARRRFRADDPIGQRVHVGRTDLPWYTVVGVVGDVKQGSLAAAATDAVYITTAQWYFADAALWFVVRAYGDPAVLATPVERALRAVDPDLPVVRVSTMADVLAASEPRRQFALTVFQLFALLALVLAAIGIYGVLAGTVAERTREIGVRAALGASRRSIIALIVRQGMALAALGAAAGVVLAMIASRALTTLLFGVSRLDPATYAGAVVLLAVVAAVAGCLPAWRAARVDPSITLRAE
jgi:putative ABC transport system permease protein